MALAMLTPSLPSGAPAPKTGTHMFSDIRLAVRGLAKTPAFSVVSVLILALGIGAITAVFSAVDAVLLRPLPFARPGELFSVRSAVPNGVGLFSIPEYRAYRDQNRSFSGLGAVAAFNTNMVKDGQAELVQGMRVSANLFQLLGAHTAAGRLLVPEDDRPEAERVVVIGYALWQRSFGGRMDVIGQPVSLNGQRHVIVGVLPRGLVLPLTGFHSDVCVPLQADGDRMRYQQGSLHYLRAIARLAPGVTEPQALADLAGILREVRRQFPNDYPGNGVNTLVPLRDQIVGDSRPMLLTLFGAVAALLLLASTNLAGLHLVRAIARRHDFAVRSALGASRFRLMRLLLAECLVLALAGGVVGLLLANWGLDSLSSLIPANLPRAQTIGLDVTVFGFAWLVTLVFGLAPALAPLWFVSRADLRTAIAAGGTRSVSGRSGARHLLASVQVALALALLACTGLFLRSFWAATAQRLGFDAGNALSVRLSLPEAGYGDRAALIRHYEHLQTRLAALPGVESVGVTSLLPLATGLATVDFWATDRPPAKGEAPPSANYRLVNPAFFTSMRIPLRDGRAFTEDDDLQHRPVAIVSAALADRLFPNHDAVGQRIEVQDTATGMRTAHIVGVVGNVKQSQIEEAPSYDVYVPYRQMDRLAAQWVRFRTFWVLRGPAPVGAWEAALRREVRAEDASIAISSVHTLGEVARAALAARRFTLMIVGFFAGTAVLLTVAGIYSVIAFGVAQRTREMGVRLALGARSGQIFRLILREGLTIAGVGAPAGLLASLWLAHLIATQLYGVSPYDPAALAAAVALIGLLTFLACWIPARRAARIDPIVALRAE